MQIKTYSFPTVVSSSKTFSANNTTATVPIFRVTGSVMIRGIHGIVTTAIGTNHTGAYWRLNDQTAQTNITLDTGGATLSSFAAGSVLIKIASSASIANAITNAAGLYAEAAAAGADQWWRFFIMKKTGANTDIEYVYTTTDTPTSGAMKFYVEYYPMSDDGAVAAV